MKSKCCRVRIRRSSIGLILEKGQYVERGVCPQCMSFCEIIEEHSRKFHAAHQLLKNIYKGMIIIVAICFLLPALLIVLMITHVIRIEHKITLSPILRTRSNHKEMR